ncbi:MAG: methyltransferase domain-containing protein [Lentisphaeria bacterium]|nr:methyltransferase domain-containing protein [Lentisphaeria bacterium]
MSVISEKTRALNEGVHILTNRWQVIDPAFGRRGACAVEMDLGCGKGALAVEMARRFPDRLIVACDVMMGRLRKVLATARREGLANLEVVRANSLDLTAYQLPPSSVDRIHVVCPDPWPKRRHQARRLLNADFMRRVVRVLKPGGGLHLATDDADYYDFMLEAAAGAPLLKLDSTGKAIADIADIKTGFELKWNGQGIDVPHVVFVNQK